MRVVRAPDVVKESGIAEAAPINHIDAMLMYECTPHRAQCVVGKSRSISSYMNINILAEIHY